MTGTAAAGDRRRAARLAGLVRPGRPGPHLGAGVAHALPRLRGDHTCATTCCPTPVSAQLHGIHPPGRRLPGRDPLGAVLRDRDARRARRRAARLAARPAAVAVGAVAAPSGALSLGRGPTVWLPWRLFSGLPLFQNIIPSRFLLVTYLAAGAMLGLIVDHTPTRWPCVSPRGADVATAPCAGGLHGGAAAVAGSRWPRWPSCRSPSYLAPTVPWPPSRWCCPPGSAPWHPTSRHQVLLVFPVPYQVIESAWPGRPSTGCPTPWSVGGGPGGDPARAGPERPGRRGHRERARSPSPARSSAPGTSPRRGRHSTGWGVTMVVLPDQPGLAPYDRVTWVPFAVGLMTAATGRAPVRQAGAWVWTGVACGGTTRRNHPGRVRPLRRPRRAPGPFGHRRGGRVRDRARVSTDRAPVGAPDEGWTTGSVGSCAWHRLTRSDGRSRSPHRRSGGGGRGRPRPRPRGAHGPGRTGQPHRRARSGRWRRCATQRWTTPSTTASPCRPTVWCQRARRSHSPTPISVTWSPC